MLRRYRFLIPLVAVTAALLGVTLADRALVAVVAAVAIAVVTEALLGRAEERRLREVADQVVRFANEPERTAALEVSGSRQWQRLVAALNDVASVLSHRFEALRDERERAQRVLDTLPTAVLLFTAERLVYANPEAGKLFALPTPVTALRSAAELGNDAIAGAVREALESQRQVTIETRHHERHFMAYASPVAPGEVALVVTDLTRRRLVEAMRRDFVANASHELKTPVTGISVLAESLGMAFERDHERARKLLSRLQDEAIRLTRLVRDLLDLTRLEEQVDERTLQRVDLRALVAGQVERLADEAQEAGVAVGWDGEEPVLMLGVPEDLKVVVRNLLANGIRYNRPGGSVHVGVRRDGAHAIITVADTGIGIPAADRGRVFERFYRVDKARSRAAGGTGLGLSLVRNAVERHGGSVALDSEVGVGSTFTVVLPVDGGSGLLDSRE